jgi:hypothetical protein
MARAALRQGSQESVMNLQERFNQLLDMEDDERKKVIKEMMPDERAAIIDMMDLPKKCSQKRLCAEIAETRRFIDIAHSKPA